VSVSAENADVNVSRLQVGGNVDLIDGHEQTLKIHFAHEEGTELSFQEFVNAEESVFHDAFVEALNG
jgi:hypothetical protein